MSDFGRRTRQHVGALDDEERRGRERRSRREFGRAASWRHGLERDPSLSKLLFDLEHGDPAPVVLEKSQRQYSRSGHILPHLQAVQMEGTQVANTDVEAVVKKIGASVSSKSHRRPSSHSPVLRCKLGHLAVRHLAVLAQPTDLLNTEPVLHLVTAFLARDQREPEAEVVHDEHEVKHGRRPDGDRRQTETAWDNECGRRRRWLERRAQMHEQE